MIFFLMFVFPSVFMTVIFFLLINREADEEAEEKVVTADIENLKWKTVEQQKPEVLDTSQMDVEFSTLLKELTPHARYAVFTREVVSKGEAKTSEIHYVQVSPGSKFIAKLFFFF